jgi:hypothetical protein
VYVVVYFIKSYTQSKFYLVKFGHVNALHCRDCCCGGAIDVVCCRFLGTKSSHENFGLSSSLSTGALCNLSASAESIVNNSTSTHEAVTEKSMFKSSGQFVRKMTSSFRSRKQIRATKIDDNNETDHGAGRGSLSVPQSPHMERIRRAVNPTISVAPPPPSSSSNHRVVGGVFVLPPVAPSTFVDSSPSREHN